MCVQKYPQWIAFCDGILTHTVQLVYNFSSRGMNGMAVKLAHDVHILRAIMIIKLCSGKSIARKSRSHSWWYNFLWPFHAHTRTPNPIQSDRAGDTRKLWQATIVTNNCCEYPIKKFNWTVCADIIAGDQHRSISMWIRFFPLSIHNVSMELRFVQVVCCFCYAESIDSGELKSNGNGNAFSMSLFHFRQ